MDNYLNKIYKILENLPQEELIKKASKKLFSNGDLLFNENGQSIEFNQYNNYVEGEPLKNIDWKQYSKTEKLYSKKFQSESNSNIVFILDTSASMKFQNSKLISKYEYSKLLFGVLSYLLLSTKSNISLMINNEFTGFKKQFSDFTLLSNSIQEEKEFNLLKKLSILQEIKLSKNSTIFIISDFMFELSDLLKEVKKMNVLNYDFYFLQILTLSELEFDYKGIIKFKDMETNEQIITEPLTIKKIYLEELNNHNKILSETLLNNNMRYKLINIDNNIELNILNLFGI